MDGISQVDITQPNVVLLHGIGRTYRIMNRMASYLRHHGFNTYNIDYPSTQYPVEKLAEIIYEQIRDLFNSPTPLHFVGHSMGSLIVRQILSQHRPQNLGRLVMLAPPNHGSKLINWLRHIWLFRKVFGPAALQMATDKIGIWGKLPIVNYETGVIAGDVAIDLLFWLLLDKPNDGKVTVASTRMDGMRDHIVLPVSHPFTPQNKLVRRQTQYFLRHGKFRHPRKRL